MNDSAKKSTSPLKSLLHTVLPKIVTAKKIKLKSNYDLLEEKIKIEKKFVAIELSLANGKKLQVRPEMKMVSLKSFKMTGRYYLADPDIPRKLVRQYITLSENESITLDPKSRRQKHLLNLTKDCPCHHLSIANKDKKLVIHNPSDTHKVTISILPSKKASQNFIKLRKKRLIRLRKIIGGDICLLNPDKALDLLIKVNALLQNEAHQPLNDGGRPGGIVNLPANKPLLALGDLHAKPNNLIVALTHSSLLEALERDRATLVINGDAVHPEGDDPLDDMENSLLIMDLILKLKLRFPNNLFYLRGNHDSFSDTIAKGGIPQGIIWDKYLTKTRGKEYRQQMQRFYDSLPYVAFSDRAIICHAGPPLFPTSVAKLVNIEDRPNLQRALTENRVKRPNQLKGYVKSDVERFRKCLGTSDITPFIVGHTPLNNEETVWKNVADIFNHYIVYSSHARWVGAIVQLGDTMYPLRYPAEPLISIINSLPD